MEGLIFRLGRLLDVFDINHDGGLDAGEGRLSKIAEVNARATEPSIRQRAM